MTLGLGVCTIGDVGVDYSINVNSIMKHLELVFIMPTFVFKIQLVHFK